MSALAWKEHHHQSIHILFLPGNDCWLWKQKYPADDTLLSSILVKYQKDYLEAPLPLTTIQNDACLAHPYLSPQNPGRATWNDQYLRCAIIRFPDVRSEVKFRLWALFSHLSLLELLIHAFEWHLPLTLLIRVNQIALFKKTKYSEVETQAFYYAAGFVTPEVSFSTDGNQQWNNTEPPYRIC